MNLPLHKFLLLGMATTIAIVCAETIKPQSFIRKRGTYTFDAAGSAVDIITAKDNKPSIAVDFHTVRDNSTNSGHYAFEQTGIFHDGWFVFIESTNRVWFFDGKDALGVAQRSGAHTKFVANIVSDPEANAACPPEVKKALPANVRESLSGKRRP